MSYGILIIKIKEWLRDNINGCPNIPDNIALIEDNKRLLDFIMQLEKKIDKEILSDGKLSDWCCLQYSFTSGASSLRW